MKSQREENVNCSFISLVRSSWVCASPISSGKIALIGMFALCTLRRRAITSGMSGSISMWLREVRDRRWPRRRGELRRRVV